MRLWHQELLQTISTQRLLGQHRECCALRGKGWGRKHKTVDYVFTHSYFYLVTYHCLVMKEMKRRGIHFDEQWRYGAYRGKQCARLNITAPYGIVNHLINAYMGEENVYPEHDENYLKECKRLLLERGDKTYARN